MTTSFVLAVLLVVSIFTHGFSFAQGIDRAIKDVENLMTRETSQPVKSQLAVIKDDLASLKSLMTQSNRNLATTSEKAKLDFYVMSQCPFGTQVEDAVTPVLDQLGANVEFRLNYIASDQGNGNFQSLHGDNEVQGDLVQLCAAKYNPDKFMDMIVCQNKDATKIPQNWEQCAKDKGLDVEKIKACYAGGEAKTLLSASILETGKVGATGSPTMYLNGNKYAGGRQTTDFLRQICNAFTTKPQACLNIPEASKVSMIVLNDKRCKACDVTNVVTQLQQLFPGLQSQTLDYGDAAGKKMYSDLQLTVLPALLFDTSVEKGEGYSNVQKYLEKKGDYWSLRIGASFDPTAEICDNGIDDTGDGLVDCADLTCQSTLICRPEIQKKLDLFVMSQCPYGLQALNAMQEVLTTFKGNIDFSIHYIADETSDGVFSSLHGQGEVDEDIRELCATKYYPEDYKYMDYIWCRNKDIKGTDWETCAKEAGMSTAMIKNCFDGTEGKQLLRDNIKLSNELQIGASPTFLANNKKDFGGIDAQTIKTNYCASNTGLAGCEKTLSGDTGGTPAGNCG